MDAAAQNLTYRTHWGLRETPFRGGLDPRWFYQGPAHEEALARLQFLIEERQRVGLLLGVSGVGKTLLLEIFARYLRRGGTQVANISLLGCDLHEFLWLLAAELGVSPNPNDDIFRLWRGVQDRIAENRYQQLDTIVLLDDANDARPEVLEQVARLAQSDRGPISRLTIVLSTTPRQVASLGPRLLEMAELRIDVEPWDESDTGHYLNWALAQAGRRAPAFVDDALIRLHALSAGVPRRVNQLAGLALLAAAGRQLPHIDAETVEAVYHELGVVEAAA